MKRAQSTGALQGSGTRDRSDKFGDGGIRSEWALPCPEEPHRGALLRLRRGAVQALLPLVPDRITLPIISGPARGMRWRRDGCNACFWMGTYERSKCEAFIRELKPTDVFYDIGANSGYYSLVAATRCKQVVAFEPFPRNIARFQANIKVNKLGNVVLIGRALSDRSGVMGFVEGPDTSSGCLSSAGTIEVSVTTLDAASTETSPPDIIKMDVEGGEVAALAGGRSTLLRFRPVLFLATHSEAIHLKCMEILKSIGYEIELLQRDEIVARPGPRA